MSTLASALLVAATILSVEPAEREGTDTTQVTPVQCFAEPISTPAALPNYTFWWSRREGRTSVPFRILVAKDGSVADVRLLPGDYHSDFARETLRAVRSWTFKPLSCRQEIGVWLQSAMTFLPPDDV